MLAILEFPDVLSNGGASNASMTLHVHVVAKRKNNRLDLRCQLTSRREDQSLRLSNGDIDGLQDGDGECRGFTSSRLRLSNNVTPLDYRQYSTLLDG